MAVYDFNHMTWEDVRDLDRGVAVPILPCGAVEAHGPHLSLTADVAIATSMARAGAQKLVHRGYEIVILPPLVYTTADFAAGFPGTITLSPQTVTSTVVDIARNLARMEFEILALANVHLDPAHLKCLHAAAEAAEEQDLLHVVFPDISGKPWATRLSEEFKSGACHAGKFETSILMADRPDFVREVVRRDLPANPTSLSKAIRDGKTSFEEAGGPRAYFGFPADADRKEGFRMIEALAGILEESVLEALRRA
jgi:creatinine amidohydrolase